MVGVKSPPFHLNRLQMLQCLSKSRSKRCAARRNRVSDNENELGTVYFFLLYNFGSVQEDDGPLRCNPSFQKQHHATKKYINPSLT